eukprot:1005427_1
MALPNNVTDEKKQSRQPFPLEIETKEEKNHPLNEYKDIASKLEEIRKLHMDAVLFEAAQKSDELAQYIQQKYPNSELLQEYESHPRIISIKADLKETNKMINFMTTDDKWELFKDDGTWKTEWSACKESAVESFRLTGVGDVPLFNIVAVIYEMDLMKTWMPLCKESKELGQLSLYSKVGYVRTGLFWPFADRECIINGFGVDDLSNGCALIYFDSKEETVNNAIKIPKCPNDRVRVDIHIGGFYFERLTDTQTKIIVVMNADSKIMVPAFVTNWVANTFAAGLIAGF